MSATDVSVAAAWARELVRDPDRELLVDARDGSRFTVAQLDLLSRKAVTLLRGWGLAAGDRLVLAAVAEMEAIVLVMGALRLGVSVVAAHPDAPAERLRTTAAVAQSAHLLTLEPHALLPGARLLRDPALLDALLAAEPSPPPAPLSLDTEAAVLFSSGSTGPAKGVCLSVRALADGIARLAAALPEDRTRDGVPARLHTITSFRITVLAPLLFGSTAVILELVPSPWVLLADAARHAVTRLHVGPGFVRAVLAAPAADAPPSGPTLIVGGGALGDAERAAFAQRYRGALVYTYGATETSGTVSASITRPGGPTQPGVGLPLVAAELRGERGEQVPTGDIGRVYVRPAAAAHAYLGGEAIGPWIDTGDLGWRDPDGYLHLLGRAARTYVDPAGMKVQLEHLEDEIRRVLGWDSVVTPVALSAQRSVLGALVQAPPLSPLAVERARAALSQALPPFAVPPLWRAVEQLPQLPSGKPDLAGAARLLAEVA